MRASLLLLLALLPFTSRAAESSVTDAQRAQLERLRGEIAGQIQLQAYDLLDELVYAWTNEPVFAVQTPVVLADVSVPVGLGTGLEGLVENHLVNLLVKNPKSGVTLAHCPQCTAVVVHSGAKGTIVARGVDEPETLALIGQKAGSRHALFLDFEAEGTSLVLRARITSLEPALPIVYAKTLSTSTSNAALLRTGERLKSASAAREEYLEALEGRGVLLVPVRIGVRTYAAPPNGASPFGVPPFVWLTIGAEVGLTQARAWTGSVSVGASWTPQLQNSWLAQARISRLLSGNSVSLTRPDVYGFVGGSMISIHGAAAQLFSPRIPTAEDFVAAQLGVEAATRFAAFQLGVELRVKNRIGVAAYLESAPTMRDAPSLGNLIDFILPFQTFGAEVSFCF